MQNTRKSSSLTYFTSLCSSQNRFTIVSYLTFLQLFHTQKKLGSLSLPLLEKSLSVSPSFIPALADKAVAQYMAGDLTNMMISLDALSNIDPTHATISGLKKAVR